MWRKTYMTSAVLAVSFSAVAGPVDGGRIAADARWVAHADVDALRGSQVGAFILDELSTGRADDKFAALRMIIGFDPRTELTDMTAYGWGERKDGIVLARGRIDAARLVTLLKANDDYRESLYGNTTIHSWMERAKQTGPASAAGAPARKYGAVAADGTIVLGNRMERMTAALDVLDGRLAGLSENGALGDLGGSSRSAFFVAAANTADMSAVAPRAAILRQTDWASLALGEVDGSMQGELSLRARDEETASSVRMIAAGMVGLTMLRGNEDPAAAALARGMRVSQNGAAVSISLACPAADVIRCLQVRKDRGFPAATP